MAKKATESKFRGGKMKFIIPAVIIVLLFSAGWAAYKYSRRSDGPACMVGQEAGVMCDNVAACTSGDFVNGCCVGGQCNSKFDHPKDGCIDGKCSE